MSLLEVLDNSKRFLAQFTDHPLHGPHFNHSPLKTLAENNPQKASECITSTRIIAHQSVLQLIPKFLEHKILYGTSVEKKFYKPLTVSDFIKHLIRDRPFAFFGVNDVTLLSPNARPQSLPWNMVGTDHERPEAPIRLGPNLSYHEMQISSLIGVSSSTIFINSGGRYNSGKVGPLGTFVESGIYLALVGPRFEKEGKMEYEYLVVTPHLSTVENGYGVDGRFVPLSRTPLAPLFNVDAYKRRIALTATTLLLEANARAVDVSTPDRSVVAYIHVVGLGLGVWQIAPIQPYLYVEAFAEPLKTHPLSHVGVVDFSWIDVDSCGGVKHGETFKGLESDIGIRFSKRDPADVLEEPPKDKTWLLVATYAWDSNSYPGNEYWCGLLTASGDPAAVCCSVVGEVQNVVINPGFLDRVKELV
ncbi:hypothetical protein BC829DRAFT_360420 [Chytridium lagenaria]|nr:hypothetical protein BC829DRAFT_360420 [Chytridium lagenaria]